jgi:hypothetical protein
MIPDILGIYHLHPFHPPWFLAEDAHQMQLTRDSDSDGIDGTGAGGATSVVTADRFILCHSVMEPMETWGGAWDLNPTNM